MKWDPKYKHIVKLRASQLHKLFSCPTRAIFEPPQPVRYADPVGMVFGSYVHAEVTGHEFVQPDTISYDNTTKHRHELINQARDAIDFAKDGLKDRTIYKTELALSADLCCEDASAEVNITGHVDILAHTDKEGIYDLIDLKTGPKSSLPQSWLQMSVYAWLCHANDITLRNVMLYSVPRGLKHASDCEFIAKPADGLREMGFRFINEAAERYVMDTAVPGNYCSTCELTKCIFHEQTNIRK